MTTLKGKNCTNTCNNKGYLASNKYKLDFFPIPKFDLIFDLVVFLKMNKIKFDIIHLNGFFLVILFELDKTIRSKENYFLVIFKNHLFYCTL